MRSIVVSAHNPMTGPRHLGHYVSTMIDWSRLQQKHELFIIIDDLIAAILYPRNIKEIQKHTFQVAKEFIATGINLDENHILLTSMLPEAHELSLFTSLAIDYHWCKKLYSESFAGLLSTYQRQQLRLSLSPSIAEVTYPQIHLATLTLGLRADFFQGGEEMRGYFGIMEAMTEQLKRKISLRVPSLLTAKSTFCIGTDGLHMASENAIYVSASEKEIMHNLSRVQSSNILKSLLTNFDQGDLIENNKSETESDERLKTNSRKASEFLTGELAKFREFQITNNEIAEILEKSAIAARERLRETLIEIKGAYQIPGFVNYTQK